jgi:hypothetical protein
MHILLTCLCNPTTGREPHARGLEALDRRLHRPEDLDGAGGEATTDERGGLGIGAEEGGCREPGG